MTDSNKILAEIKRTVIGKYPDAKIILYGSRARARQPRLKKFTTKSSKNTKEKIALQFFFIKDVLISCFSSFSWLNNISMAQAVEIKKLNAVALRARGDFRSDLTTKAYKNIVQL